MLLCIQISHQEPLFFLSFFFQPAVVHLQGQETTIQVREGGSFLSAFTYSFTTFMCKATVLTQDNEHAQSLSVLSVKELQLYTC